MSAMLPTPPICSPCAPSVNVLPDPSQCLLYDVAAGAYQITSETYDPTYFVIQSGVVLWMDGTTGVYTSLVINHTWFSVDSYSITHPVTGQTVTQPTVTRDGLGRVIVTPPLVLT